MLLIGSCISHFKISLKHLFSRELYIFPDDAMDSRFHSSTLLPTETLKTYIIFQIQFTAESVIQSDPAEQNQHERGFGISEG